MSRAGIAFGLLAFLFILACQKSDLSTSVSTVFSSNDTLLNDTLLNDTLLIDSPSIRLSYGDSIFSASVTGNEKRVFPVSKPGQPGFFAANLPGLDLDSITGRINLSKSESGLRYL